MRKMVNTLKAGLFVFVLITLLCICNNSNLFAQSGLRTIFEQIPKNCVTTDKSIYAEVVLNRDADVQKIIHLYEVTHSDSSNYQLEALRDLSRHRDRVHAIAFSNDGSMMASSDEDNNIFIWNTRTWNVVQQIDDHEATPVSLMFCENDRFLVSGDIAGNLGIWRLEDGSFELQRLMNNSSNAAYYSLAYTETDSVTTGKFIAAGRSDGRIDILEYYPGLDLFQPKYNLNLPREHSSTIYSLLAMERDSMFYLLLGLEDGSILVFDLNTQQIQELTSHSGAVWRFYSSPDGNYFASLSLDRTITVWSTTSEPFKEIWGEALGYIYYQGICSNSLFDISDLGLPAMTNVISASQVQTIKSEVEEIVSGYSLEHEAGRRNMIEMINQIRGSYPQYQVTLVQYSPTKNFALVRALEETLGLYKITVRYGYGRVSSDSPGTTTDIAQNVFAIQSPFTTFGIGSQLGETSGEILDYYHFTETYDFRILDHFTEDEDYIIITHQDYTDSDNGHWVAIMNFKQDTNATYSGDLLEYSGIAYLDFPRESREMAKLIAITNMINCVGCSLRTRSAFANLVTENEATQRAMLSTLYNQNFAFTHRGIMLRGVVVLEDYYDIENQLYFYTIGVHEEDYRVMMQTIENRRRN